MKTYICSNCGYTCEAEENSVFVCPNCGKREEEYKKSDNEIDAIIDSVLEEVMEGINSKIINISEKQKSLTIADNNRIINKIEDKCINCGQCKKVCEKVANIEYDLNKCKNPICTSCGECVLNCPTNALVFKENYREVKRINDLNEKIVVALVSPSVYEYLFEIIKDEDVEKVFVGALKQVGFDYVFNAAFAEDLKVLEEVTEFAERLKNKKLLPMISSSCSSWIDYAQVYHPELLDNISTCKVPIQMHSALVKTYFTNEKGFDTSKIVTVSIGNCTSVRLANNDPLNVDFNITLNELMLLFKEENIDLNNVNKSDYDELLSEASGSAYITSVAGGSSEAFARTFYRIMKKTKLRNDEIDFLILRKIDGIRSANIKVGDYTLRMAVVEGLANFEKLVMNDKLKNYHYIEVMNCKKGCFGGAGRIIGETEEFDKDFIYEKDKKMSKRCSHDNKEIKNVYSSFLKRPLSEKCLEILHCGYKDNSNMLNDK